MIKDILLGVLAFETLVGLVTYLGMKIQEWLLS